MIRANSPLHCATQSHPDEKPPSPSASPPTLEYAPKRPQRGFMFWVSRFLASLSRPMSMGRLYLIMTALSVIATILAVILVAIVKAFR